MENLFKEHKECIKLYIGIETQLDPYEKNVDVTLLNPIPIKGVVTDLTSAKIQWAMPGIVADKAKEIIIEKKYENMLKQSQKIEVRGEFFEGWKVNHELQYRIEGDYLRAYIYVKKVS